VKTPTARVDKLLGSMGYGSRTEMARLGKAGGIVLDGADLTDVSKRIAVTPDLPARMEVDGEPLDPAPGLVMMLNKPLGMTCSRKEDGALVYDVLPGRWRRRDPAISTIGRLDKQTTGLLLLTDDGDLLHRVISPKRHVAKVYRATLARPLDGTEGRRVRRRGSGAGGRGQAAVEVLSPGRDWRSRQWSATTLSLPDDRRGGG
jgi:16S rRNA pseudouridine516 synthase